MIFTFLRITSFFTSCNVMFPSGTPRQFKTYLCLILSLIISMNLGIEFNISNYYEFIYYGVIETMTGLFLGYITTICFSAIKIAGSLIDTQVGLSMSSMYDSVSGNQSTLIENILYWVGIMIFLATNGHHVLINGLRHSFEIIPIGEMIINNNIEYIISIFIKYFSLGFQIAVPVLLTMVMTELVMGLVSRSVPQFNVMIIGMPIKMLVGLILLITVLPSLGTEMSELFANLASILSGTFK